MTINGRSSNNNSNDIRNIRLDSNKNSSIILTVIVIQSIAKIHRPRLPHG